MSVLEDLEGASPHRFCCFVVCLRSHRWDRILYVTVGFVKSRCHHHEELEGSGTNQAVPNQSPHVSTNDKRRTFLWPVSRSRGLRKGNRKITPLKTKMTLENPPFP